MTDLTFGYVEAWMYFHIGPRGVAEMNVFELNVSFDHIRFVAFIWETVDAGFLWTKYSSVWLSPYKNRDKHTKKELIKYFMFLAPDQKYI